MNYLNINLTYPWFPQKIVGRLDSRKLFMFVLISWFTSLSISIFMLTFPKQSLINNELLNTSDRNYYSMNLVMIIYFRIS